MSTDNLPYVLSMFCGQCLCEGHLVFARCMIGEGLIGCVRCCRAVPIHWYSEHLHVDEFNIFYHL